MSSSKDSGGGVSKNILTLEGTSNYDAWLPTIWSFLMTLKVWRITSGETTCPAAAGPDQNTWLDLDYQAVGVISLYVKEDLHMAVTLTYEDPKVSLAFHTLANLATLYAMTRPTGQFYLFRDIVNWRLGGGDPSAEIAHLVELFAWLSGAGLVLPDNLKAMLLCTGLGDDYTSLVTTTVHTIGTTEFTPTKLIPMILAELQQQSTSLANCIAPASSSKGQTIKKANPSTRCKICGGSLHTMENCWKLTGKSGSKLSGNQTNNQQ